VSATVCGAVTARITPARMRLTYQPNRITPCDWWPHRSAVTRLSATNLASGSGTPTAVSIAEAKSVNREAPIR
jgi:hypothetical protein